VNFRIYNQSIFKLLVPLIIGGLGVYYYANNDISKYLKLGILVLFLGHNSNQYFFIVLTILLFNTKILLPFKTPVKYLYLMLGIGGLSFLLNQVIEINLYSFPFFLASFFLPVAFYSITQKYGNEIIKQEIVDFYIMIVFLLSISALYQYLFFGAIVDGLTGGTTSAHTLGFHLAVAFILYLCRLMTMNGIKDLTLYDWALGLSIIPIMYLSDSKYLMGNMIIGFFIIYMFYHTNKILKPFLIMISALLLFLSADIIRTANFTMSVKSDINISNIGLRFTDSAKYQLYEKTIKLPFNEPLVFLFGSGPGTFLSRAANSRAFDTMDKKTSTGGGSSVEVESKLPSFIPAHTSWVTKEYAVMYFGQDWFGTLLDFRSSLVSLFWEFGVIGFVFFILFFYKIIHLMNRAKRKFKFLKPDALFIQSFIVFYFLNAALAYYFEYPNTQILFWMFIGLYTNRELMSNLSK
jgi:hypothetical protein